MGVSKPTMRLSLIGLGTCLASALASAAPLPYTTRTRPFGGYTSTVRGDIRTLGMAGATLGLGDSLIASFDNPAGLAISLNGSDVNFTSGWVRDGYVQTYDQLVAFSNYGGAFSLYPWGFGVGVLTASKEEASFDIAGFPGDPAVLQVMTNEIHASIARVFIKNRFSLGASFILGIGETAVRFGSGTNPSAHALVFAPGGAVSGTFQFPARVLMTLSVSSGMRYPNHAAQTSYAAIPNFFQEIWIPARFGWGFGWIPNRFFRADLSLLLAGMTSGAALMADNAVLVGANTSFQPRVGASYQWLDFKELKSTVFLGTYYESSRITGKLDRLHGTAGIELKPWVLYFGAAADLAWLYMNATAAVGIDVVKIFEKLDLIPPTQPKMVSGGFLPSPFRFLDEGLPRPLVKNWKATGPAINPIRVGLEMPGRIRDKAKKTGRNVLDAIGSIPQPMDHSSESAPEDEEEDKEDKP